MLNTWMSNNAKQIIIDNLKSTDNMLEFGSGGSTLEFSKYVKNYYSVEFNKEWYKKIGDAIITNNLNNIYYTYAQVNAPNYTNFINKFKDYNIPKIDKVLIDGRERVKCAKEIIPYITKDTLVFIHDWERTNYHEVLKWYDIINVSKLENHYSPGNQSALTVVLKLK